MDEKLKKVLNIDPERDELLFKIFQGITDTDIEFRTKLISLYNNYLHLSDLHKDIQLNLLIKSSSQGEDEIQIFKRIIIYQHDLLLKMAGDISDLIDKNLDLLSIAKKNVQNKDL